MQRSIATRPATAADWPSMWPIVRAVVAEGRTYTLPRDLDEEDARRMWFADHAIVACEADGSIVGIAKTGPNQRGPGGHVATASFMFGPAVRGRGVGRLLGQAVIDWATTAGFRSMQFNAVVETNVSAVALWRSLGFVVVGTVPEAFEHPEHGRVALLVMHRFL